MHTAVCTFQHRDTAEQARERLLRSGWDRHDVHIEHRRDDAGTHAGEDPRGWSGTDHEIAVDRDMVDKVAGFFVQLFGRGHPEGHDRLYGQAVEQGRYVLVVDARDDTEAQRAHTLLHDLQAEDMAVVHRPSHPPVRDIVGAQEEGGWAGSYQDRASAFDRGESADLLDKMPAHVESPERTQAAFHGRSTDWTDDRTDERTDDRTEAARERALAAGQVGEPRPVDLPDPDLDRVGLRYADKEQDKDKPR
jgi:hypothetical protein